VFSRWESAPAALFIRATDVAQMLMGANFGRVDKRLAWLRRCPLIVVDDLGREANDNGGYISAGIFELICNRFEDAQRTIVTTNLDRVAFQKRYGAALFDRFIANGAMSTLDGGDYQRQPSEQS